MAYTIIICRVCGHPVIIRDDNVDHVKYMCGHYVHDYCFDDYNPHNHRICPECGLFSWVLYFG